MSAISGLQKSIANEGKQIFEKHVFDVVEVEVTYREKINIPMTKVLDDFKDYILSNYNIVSYNARRTILINSMKAEVIIKTAELRTSRSKLISGLESKYSESRISFRNNYLNLATALITSTAQTTETW